MSAFLSFLGGLSEGGLRRYRADQEAARKLKEKNDELIAKALEERIKSDDTLTPEDQDQLFTQILTLRGADKKVVEALRSAGGYARAALAEQKRSQPGIAPALEGTFDLPEFAGIPAQRARVDIPESPFGPMPQRTIGEIKFERERPMRQALARDTAEAQREAARVAATGAIEDKIAIYNKYRGTEMEDEVGRMLGMVPRAAGGVAPILPTTMSGADVKAALLAQGRIEEAALVDPNKSQRVVLSPDRTQIQSAYPVENRSTGSPPVVIDQAIVDLYKNDATGRPLVAGQSYVPRVDTQTGKVIGFVPETEFGTVRTSQAVNVTTDAAGNVVQVVTPVTSITQKTAPGMGPFGQIPSMPIAPRTATEAPPRVSGSRIIGARPIEIPEGKMDSLKSLQDLRVQGATIRELLPKVQRFVGPLAGRGTKYIYENLGGLGLPDDVVTFYTTLKELIATKAFERGGKTLPLQEQKIYTSQLPNGSETMSALVAKLNVILPLLEKDYQNQLKGLTANQRKQFLSETGQLGPSGDIPRPSPGQPLKYKKGDIIQSGPYKGKKVVAIHGSEIELE
jgi:hypothetical protein